MGYFTTSDERLKTNITPTKYGLKELKQIEVKITSIRMMIRQRKMVL
ncbi:MAG: tail fiber domain-containing protein [Bacteroidetes bacterium]|nr:tail fiber domain-containing protein [Bacteroidota bacterium]